MNGAMKNKNHGAGEFFSYLRASPFIDSPVLTLAVDSYLPYAIRNATILKKVQISNYPKRRMAFLQEIREFVWEYPWILAITIPGLAYLLYWIWIKIHPTERNMNNRGRK
jgi:hypothetical protein